MRAGAPLSVADWVVAVFELEPQGDAFDEVRRMLQIDSPVEMPASRATGAHKTLDVPLPLPKVSHPARAKEGTTPGTSVGAAQSDDVRTIASPPLTRSRATPARVQVVDTPFDLSGDEQHGPPIEPLFATHQARAIVSAAVATRRHDGDVDIMRALRDLTQLRRLRKLPRLPRASLQLGCQILVDYSRAMEPYADDREALVHALQVTVGEPRVSVYAFRGPPLDHARSGTSGWRPPPRGTPIVVISDLGIGGPPLDRHRTTREDWIAVARRARRARCPVLAFVPFGSRRWDPVLTRLIMHVHWDRPTSAGVVRRAIGPGHPTT